MRPVSYTHLVVELLNKPLTASVKSIVLAVDHQDEKGNPLPAKIVLLLLRGDHTLNEVKAEKLEALKGGFRFATDKEIEDTFGSKPGYLGPVAVSYTHLTVKHSVRMFRCLRFLL